MSSELEFETPVNIRETLSRIIDEGDHDRTDRILDTFVLVPRAPRTTPGGAILRAECWCGSTVATPDTGETLTWEDAKALTVHGCSEAVLLAVLGDDGNTVLDMRRWRHWTP